MFLFSKTTRAHKQSAYLFIKRRNINSELLQEFKQRLLLVDWDFVTILQNSKVACNRVLEIFSGFYDIAFRKQNIKIRDKTLKILEIKRPSRVYQKKTKIVLNSSAKSCTIYKILFETLKKKSKKSYYLNLTDKFKNYIKKT